jgi:uncharacterized protein (TIGR00251 family)
VELTVKVVPGSSQSRVSGTMADGTLKARVTAPPERGKANAELMSLLARHFGVRERDVEILSGHSSPLKKIRISGLRNAR